MSGLTGDEPDLKVGDSGEGVVLLQVRLYGLGLYRTTPDGTFDMTTENAVRELQAQIGHDNTGEVTTDTWQGILYWEQQYGINYQYTSPYDALSQLVFDQQNPGVNAYQHGQLSEDGQWQWDGSTWQSVSAGGQAGASAAHAGQLSEDGQWRWDGSTWQAAHADGQAGSGDSYVGQLSPDGLWRWDGYQWQAA